jgi:Cu(I)/Ag(I) efflux system membrane fusion protein/cobalt-zinc-cadmium efflux system membrane fusion protein
MKRKHFLYIISGILIAAVAAVGVFAFLQSADAKARPSSEMKELYVCSMHPWEQASEPGSCTECGMALSQVEGFAPGDSLPSEDELYVDPENPIKVSIIAHEGWIPIVESPYYQPRQGDEPTGHDDFMESGGDSAQGMEMDHSEMEGSSKDSMQGENSAETSTSGLWTCGMHPEVIQDHPGDCPICHMKLTPLKKGRTAGGGVTVSIDPVTMQNIGVVTTRANRMDLYRDVRSNGTVEVAEENETRVNSRISGWVEHLKVNRTGDPVKKGQVLLELYSPELVSAQEEYILALNNSETLRASGVDHVRENGTQLVEAARRRLDLWNIAESEIEKIERTRKVQRTLPLKSPADGIILSKDVVEGSAVKNGMDLFTIADLGKVWVEAQVYEYELPWISEGDRVVVTSPYETGLRLEGHIDYLYPTLDPRSRTAKIRIVLDNPNLQLRPDMYVDVLVKADPRQDVVAVKKSAVIRSGKRDIVFVKRGKGLFEPREVHLGVETDYYYEIKHNLQPGEEVVTSAQFLLDSEAKLQEAIQRRIAQRTAMGKETGEMEMDSASPEGHQH